MKLKDLLLIIQTNQYISINIREKENSLNIKKNWWGLNKPINPKTNKYILEALNIKSLDIEINNIVVSFGTLEINIIN